MNLLHYVGFVQNNRQPINIVVGTGENNRTVQSCLCALAIMVDICYLPQLPRGSLAREGFWRGEGFRKVQREVSTYKFFVLSVMLIASPH